MVSLTDGRKHSAGRALIEKGFSGSREASEDLQEGTLAPAVL